MQTLIVKTENEAAAKLLMAFLKTVRLVKSVTLTPDYSETKLNTVNEPITPYNWTNPDRPATDEEFEQLAVEMENDTEEHSADDILAYVNEELKSWSKRKR